MTVVESWPAQQRSAHKYYCLDFGMRLFHNNQNPHSFLDSLTCSEMYQLDLRVAEVVLNSFDFAELIVAAVAAANVAGRIVESESKAG